MITGKYPSLRLRRNRKNNWSRRLVEENNLTPNDFILPIFLIDGKNKKLPIKTMPDVFRYSLDKLSYVVDNAIKKGLPMIALFPNTDKKKKNEFGTEALNEDNLVCRALQIIKKRYKNKIGIMCDVALDPYTSHGHDGLIKKKEILNDKTIQILIKQSLLQAEMGCDVIAPSDMIYYDGDLYPELKNSFLVTALKSKDVKKIKKINSLFSEESIFSNLKSRLRSIGISPSGEIYLLTDGRKGNLLKVTFTEK